MDRIQVSVFGTARSKEGDADYAEAQQLGRLLAEAGLTVCTGGYSGAMEAVSRGAHEAGGHVVGITVEGWDEGGRAKTPNRWVIEEIRAASLASRVERLVESDALVAMRGGIGTLLEIAMAWNMMQVGQLARKPLILVGASWRAVASEIATRLIVDQGDMALVTVVDNVEDAVAALQQGIIKI
ncbi:MAG: DNA-binding protein [Candidatus Chloroheliales bacterium]|nr:MAG: DNA-binding protein [Chloroflexota bacterium]